MSVPGAGLVSTEFVVVVGGLGCVETPPLRPVVEFPTGVVGKVAAAAWRSGVNVGEEGVRVTSGRRGPTPELDVGGGTLGVERL